MSAIVVAIVSDLIFATKISSTAASLGVDLRMARTTQRVAELLKEHPAAAIIDLACDQIDAMEAIRVLSIAEPRPRIVAFASHVEADRIAAARAAGADEVLARSALATRLPEILRRAAVSRPAP